MDLQIGTLMGIPGGDNHLRKAFNVENTKEESNDKDANFLLNTYGQIAVGSAAGATQGGICGALVGGTAALVSKMIDKATEKNDSDNSDSDDDNTLY